MTCGRMHAVTALISYVIFCFPHSYLPPLPCMHHQLILPPLLSIFVVRTTFPFISHYPILPSPPSLTLLELEGSSWQVTRVVKPDEMERPEENLTEQMRKLELSPQEGKTHSHPPLIHTKHMPWSCPYFNSIPTPISPRNPDPEHCH